MSPFSSVKFGLIWAIVGYFGQTKRFQQLFLENKTGYELYSYCEEALVRR